MEEIEIAIEDIAPNSWNPNELEADVFSVLKDSINVNGFLQRILVRPKATEKARYEIIDGYHRYKSLKELGAKTVMCRVEEHTDAEAMLLTIAMNRFRGSLNAVKMAKIFNALKDTYSTEELSKKLGYTMDYVENVMALEGKGGSILEELVIGEESADKLYPALFYLQPAEYNTVIEALDKFGKEGKEASLLGIINWYSSKK